MYESTLLPYGERMGVNEENLQSLLASKDSHPLCVNFCMEACGERVHTNLMVRERKNNWYQAGMASSLWPRVRLSSLASLFFFFPVQPALIWCRLFIMLYVGLETASEWSRLSGEASGKVFPQN